MEKTSTNEKSSKQTVLIEAPISTVFHTSEDVKIEEIFVDQQKGVVQMELDIQPLSEEEIKKILKKRKTK